MGTCARRDFRGWGACSFQKSVQNAEFGAWVGCVGMSKLVLVGVAGARGMGKRCKKGMSSNLFAQVGLADDAEECVGLRGHGRRDDLGHVKASD